MNVTVRVSIKNSGAKSYDSSTLGLEQRLSKWRFSESSAVTLCRCILEDMNIGIFIWTLGWTLTSHLPETFFLFKNLSSEVWRHFRAMRIFCIDRHYFAFLRIMKILKLLFSFTIATKNQKKLFIYYKFLLKVVHTIKLLFSILRELNIGWYQRR